MKTKNLILPVFAFLLVLTSLTFVSAAVSIVQPIIGTNSTGTSVFTAATYTNSSSDVVAPLEANSTFYCNVSGSWESYAISSWVLYPANVSFTIDVGEFGDGIGGCNMTLGNTTTEAIGDTDHTPVTFDSTPPVISIAIIQDTISMGRVIQYTPTSTDATSGIASLTCDVTDPDSVVTTLSTTSGSDFDYELDRTANVGTYIFDCDATDYAGNTASATDIELDVNDQGFSVSQKKKKAVGDNTTIMVVLAIIAAAWYWKKR